MFKFVLTFRKGWISFIVYPKILFKLLNIVIYHRTVYVAFLLLFYQLVRNKYRKMSKNIDILIHLQIFAFMLLQELVLQNRNK